MHVHLEENKAGRDFIVGDIHGCFDLFMQALKTAGFSYEGDRLISVGDIIDRGPDSEKCLDLLDIPWFHMVRGNHEQMMIDSVLTGIESDWSSSYGSWSNDIPEPERRDWARRIAARPTSLSLDCGDFQAGICHAEPPGHNWANIYKPGADTQMLWGRKCLHEPPNEDVKGIDITIHGHTPLEQPSWVDNRYFMDTGAWYTGTLTLRNIQDIWDEYKGASRLFKA